MTSSKIRKIEKGRHSAHGYYHCNGSNAVCQLLFMSVWCVCSGQPLVTSSSNGSTQMQDKYHRCQAEKSPQNVDLTAGVTSSNVVILEIFTVLNPISYVIGQKPASWSVSMFLHASEQRKCGMFGILGLVTEPCKDI